MKVQMKDAELYEASTVVEGVLYTAYASTMTEAMLRVLSVVREVAQAREEVLYREQDKVQNYVREVQF